MKILLIIAAAGLIGGLGQASAMQVTSRSGINLWNYFSIGFGQDLRPDSINFTGGYLYKAELPTIGHTASTAIHFQIANGSSNGWAACTLTVTTSRVPRVDLGFHVDSARITGSPWCGGVSVSFVNNYSIGHGHTCMSSNFGPCVLTISPAS